MKQHQLRRERILKEQQDRAGPYGNYSYISDEPIITEEEGKSLKAYITNNVRPIW